MKKTGAFLITALFALAVSGCTRTGNEVSAVKTPASFTVPEASGTPGDLRPGAVEAVIFVKENTDGTGDGVERLLAGMGGFFRQGNGPGLIGAEDVVLIKINSQWRERGGTNTDVVKGIIQYILKHPGGFKGEVIIADNGQGRGNLDWDNTNAKDKTQSAQDVADYFAGRGYRVSGVLWDRMTDKRVGEFEAGNNEDGYVIEDGVLSTGLIVSYAKFTTTYGTPVSFKKGIWNVAAKRYDSEKLKVINTPVLKSHGTYQVTGALKSYMGTPSIALTGRSPHNNVGRGAMGTQMVKTRYPVLNILDMVWVTPEGGPNAPYAMAVQKNMIAASVDPAALDYWASKPVLMPTAAASGNRRSSIMDPDGREPGTFGYWLRLTVEELQKGGFPVTTDESRITVTRVN
jgi:uncharacterized protein (DUF362 family)